MDRQERIAGGLFIVVLMLFTVQPFNNDIQSAAAASGASEAVQVIALVFPIFYVGIMFTVLALTGYDVMQEFG